MGMTVAPWTSWQGLVTSGGAHLRPSGYARLDLILLEAGLIGSQMNLISPQEKEGLMNITPKDVTIRCELAGGRHMVVA
jgi:hypothetical protein